MTGARLEGIEHCAGAKRVSGKPAPRYCFVCGLGPCKYGHTKLEKQMPGDDGQVQAHLHDLSTQAAEEIKLKPKAKVTFTAELGDKGLWYVTSPNFPGLLSTGTTLVNAMDNAGQAIIDLAIAAAQGGKLKDIFKPTE